MDVASKGYQEPPLPAPRQLPGCVDVRLWRHSRVPLCRGAPRGLRVRGLRARALTRRGSVGVGHAAGARPRWRSIDVGAGNGAGHLCVKRQRARASHGGRRCTLYWRRLEERREPHGDTMVYRISVGTRYHPRPRD